MFNTLRTYNNQNSLKPTFKIPQKAKQTLSLDYKGSFMVCNVLVKIASTVQRASIYSLRREKLMAWQSPSI